MIYGQLKLDFEGRAEFYGSLLDPPVKKISREQKIIRFNAEINKKIRDYSLKFGSIYPKKSNLND